MQIKTIVLTIIVYPNCQVCSDLQSFSCNFDCIDDSGEYDDACLKNWGDCLH